MGEVWKARDTRLERTVAIKVLSPQLSTSEDSRQRFEREARTISQLSHAHICALYDVGSEDGTEYLVMEYLEGETLSDRLARGALPLDQTLRYGSQIADALDKAHRQGIVHRDLKPGNVMLTKSGVKLLDFGLAKVFEPPAPKGSLTALPTKAALTQEGTILGTFQYMAPEQLEGKEADARTDIFALGAVLYEMATGRKAFASSSQASLITAIMSADPAPISSVQPMAPPALDRIVKTCLAKDPEDRWQSAHDVAGQLQGIAETSGTGFAVPAIARKKSREGIAWALAALFLVGMVAALLRRPSAPPSSRAVRFQLPLAGGTGVTSGLVISPDGTRLAFVAPAPGTDAALWLRPLDALEARTISGTEGARMPFWSPDGRALGFFAGGSLKTIDVASGLVRTLSSTAYDPRGGAWGPDGTIVFAPNFQSNLMRVSAGGGAPKPATVLDSAHGEQTHRWPSFLPDGRHFLYYASTGSGQEPGEIFAGCLDGGPPKHLVTSASLGLYAEPGHLLFDTGRNLVAQPFDPKRLEVSGEPVPLAGQISRIIEFSGFRPLSVSGTGVLVYQLGTPSRASRLVWLDRSGKELGTLAEGLYYGPKLSRDGTRLAVTRWDPDTTVGDIWLFDLARGVGSRFTFDPADDSICTWTPDGKRVIFGSSRTGAVNLWQAAADRPGTDEPLHRSPDFEDPDDVSPDGRFVLYETVEKSQNGRVGLFLLPLSGDARPWRFSGSALSEQAGSFSPDGRWLAFASNESGRSEVYVASFPGSGGKWQISINGGGAPSWRGDGRELFFYAADGTLMSSEVAAGASFEAAPAKALFKIGLVLGPDRQYAFSPDGQRVLANVSAGSADAFPAAVVLDWTTALKTGGK
jgi:Tol biopolymer transport system component/predicted Ser/Thr protein kinase